MLLRIKRQGQELQKGSEVDFEVHWVEEKKQD